MSHRFFTLDVFTKQRLSGNPLAVVLDADDLSAESMLAIAGEFNLSETIFVLTPKNDAHSARVRIFSPARELPFAGHPTVGCAILLANLQARLGSREGDAMVVLEEEIGLVRAGVRVAPNDGPSFAVFDVPRLPQEDGGAPSKEELAHTLGLMPSDLGFDNFRPMRASAGVPFVFVPVRDRGALRRCRVNVAAWDAMFEGDWHGAIFIYCREPENPEHHFRARMMAYSMGIPEDPATGSACAAFAAVLERFEPLQDGLHQFWIEQGYEMGRPSQISLEMDLVGGMLKTVRIGGHAVITQEGTLRL